MICNFVTEKKWAHRLLAPVTALLLGAAVFCGPVGAQLAPLPPLSLKDVVAPEPTNLQAFLKDTPEAKQIAIALGKALFWDMQVGSDDVQACASCHFNAGADSRTKNQLTPSDGIFGNATTDPTAIAKIGGTPPSPNDLNYGFGPNFDLTAEHFPFHRRSDPTGPFDETLAFILMDTNDVVSSQGVRLNDSATNIDGEEEDIFNWKEANVRKVEPRNAPSMINAVFHLDMFWDGRASFVFNGVNPFGFRDRDAKVLKNVGTDLSPIVQPVTVRIPLAGHASQSVGPPLSNLEMSGFIRSFTELADKLLDPTLNPLAIQMVHPEDSVLGPYAMADYVLNKKGRPTGKINNVPGTKIPGTVDEKLTYQQLIQDAFKEEWWNGGTDAEGVDQMVNNFTLFFGLAMQLYQGSLVADDTPFDRFVGANFNVRGGGGPIVPEDNALTQQEQDGLALFQAVGCINCHILPETSNHVVRLAGLQAPTNFVNNPLDPVNVLVPQTILELMPMGNAGQPDVPVDGLGVYDTGFYNIAVRPTDEDFGRAGTAMGLPLSFAELAFMKFNGTLFPDVAQFVPDQGIIENPDGTITELPLSQLFARAENRIVTEGAFKVPTLRNQEFQGPYFHTGGDATLRQVVEFYARGGNFPATNIDNLDADMGAIPEFDVATNPDAETNIQALVAFLSNGLTDPRVKLRQAPFDHPQLFIPEGVTGRDPLFEKLTEIHATGAAGAGVDIPRFLNLDPQMSQTP